MKKHHVHTTLSPRHWAMLQKLTEKYETQQKAIEAALENMESGPKQGLPQTLEDRIWVQWGADFRKVLVLMQQDSYKVLLDNTDIDRFIEYMADSHPMKFAMEYVYGKPLKDFSLKELLDAIVLKVRVQNTADMINYSDEGEYYSLNISHSLGLNHSKVLQMGKESIFKSYGAKIESSISDNSVFIKVYKNK